MPETTPEPGQPTTSWTTALALGLGAGSLGFAVQVDNGDLAPAALVWLTIAVALAIFSALDLRIPFLERRGAGPVVFALGLALAGQFAQLLTTVPALYLPHDADTRPFLAGVGMAAFLCGAGLSSPGWLGRVRMPVLLLVHFLLGAWIIDHVPSPKIDVDMFQRTAIDVLLHGHNPYAHVYPDIYNGAPGLYPPGTSIDGLLTFGIPYPPVTLLMAIPGDLVGDYRYSQLFAITATGALIAYARPGRLSQTIATLFLFTPRVFFVIEEGWIEPLVLLLLALAVFCACRGLGKVVPYVLGLFLASKQYLVFVAPLALFLLPRPWRWREVLAFAGKAMAVACAITLPFFLWNPERYMSSVVALQAYTPFRKEALSYLAWFFASAPDLPSPWWQWLAPALAIVVGGITFWRTPRTIAGYCIATAAVAIALFAFAKQAFCNYYFFGIGVLCLAFAVLDLGQSAPANGSSADTRSR